MESCASKIVYLDVFFPNAFQCISIFLEGAQLFSILGIAILRFALLKGSPEKRTTSSLASTRVSSGFHSIDSAIPICVMEIANGCAIDTANQRRRIAMSLSSLTQQSAYRFHLKGFSHTFPHLPMISQL